MHFLSVYGDKLIIALLQHMEILVITLVISLALAAVLTILATYSPRTGRALVHIFSAIYSIPSLALFAILIPLTGLGMSLSTLEMVILNGEMDKDGTVTVTKETLEQCTSKKSLLYDRNGEEHYNLISALHKSMIDLVGIAPVYYINGNHDNDISTK